MSKYLSQEEALKKLQRYCAYQDRCHQEVRRKLLGLKVYGETLEAVITDLIEDNFLNEERFARSYARGKFRMKRWGWRRISQELKKREISTYCIRKAKEEIPDEAYLETLEKVLHKRFRDKPAINTSYAKRQDLIKYGISRGYETPLVITTTNKIIEGAFNSK